MTVQDKPDDRVLRVRVTEALLDVLAPGLPFSDVRAAVDTVIKLVREQAAQDIEAEAVGQIGSIQGVCLNAAARVVRGGR